MQSCIADDGLASVKTDTDYAAALNIYYYYINAKYQWIAQKEDHSLEEYKTQFLEAVANMRHVNYQPIPSDVRHFFMKWHLKNIAFQVHVKNKDNNQFPQTIQQVIEQCERFVCVGSSVKGQPMMCSSNGLKNLASFNHFVPMTNRAL